MRLWDLATCMWPGDDLGPLLDAGWEPIGASVVPGMAATHPDGQRSPVQIVTLKRRHSPVEVAPGELARLPRPTVR